MVSTEINRRFVTVERDAGNQTGSPSEHVHRIPASEARGYETVLFGLFSVFASSDTERTKALVRPLRTRFSDPSRNTQTITIILVAKLYINREKNSTYAPLNANAARVRKDYGPGQ